MSLLLDALKKSEAQRRRGEIPRFEGGSGLGSDRSGMRASRRGLLLAAFLLVLAVGVTAWWLTGSAPDGVAGSPVVADGQVPADAGSGVTEYAAGADAADGGGAEQSVVAETSPQPAASPESAPESLEQTAPEASPPPPAPVAGSVESEPGDPAPSRLVTARARPASGRESPTPVALPEPAPPQTEEEAEAETEAESPDWIRPWELPQAERGRFPELRLSVHFYAPQAADRFVLINGEQYRQGDRIQDVRIAEIRRRGVVLDFGQYRILLE